MSDTRGAERWQIKLSDFAKECDYDVDKIRQQIQLGMKVTHSDMQMAVSGNWSQELFQLLLEEYKKAHTVTSLNLISHYICLSAYMVNPRVAKDRYFEQQTADEIHKNEEKYESLLLKLKSLLKAGSNFIGIEIKLVSSAGPEVLAILLESGYRLTEETLKEFIARYMSPPHWIDVLRERNLLTEELFKMSMSALCMSRDVELHAALGDLGSVQKYMLSTKVTEPFLFNLYAKMALQYAVLFQRYETAMLLLGMGAETNDEGYLLSMSVERCDVRMTRLLLSSPAIRLDVISHIGSIKHGRKIIVYELGIRSENIEIRALFAAKKAEMSEHIETLIAAIRTKIKILETSAQSWFGIGNGSKARQLSEALARAEAAKESCLSLDTFLRYKQDGLISIEEALTIKRIGFSNPNSKNEIDNLVEELTGVKPGKK